MTKENQHDKETKPQKEKMVSVKESELEELKQEAGEYKDKFIRLYAEFENARKRMEREKFEFIKYANEGLVTEFLNILDDLERSVEAAKANHQDYTAFLKGIEMVMAHVYDMLKKNNVKPIEAKGKPFDPHLHEALMQEGTDQHPEGTIVEEFQKGYLLGDRVVRTSKVKVATTKLATADDADKVNADDADNATADDADNATADDADKVNADDADNATADDADKVNADDADKVNADDADKVNADDADEQK
ncbi:MAG: nucleotide exchange factor GrpE [Candidatus Omnitrophota bacterium]